MITHTSLQGSIPGYTTAKCRIRNLHCVTAYVRPLFIVHKGLHSYGADAVIFYNVRVCKLSTIIVCFLLFSCREKFPPPSFPHYLLFACLYIFIYFFVKDIYIEQKWNTNYHWQ